MIYKILSFLTLLILLSAMSCEYQNSKEHIILGKKTNFRIDGSAISEFKYENCDYIYTSQAYSSITHKGNCTNPIHDCK